MNHHFTLLFWYVLVILDMAYLHTCSSTYIQLDISTGEGLAHGFLSPKSCLVILTSVSDVGRVKVDVVLFVENLVFEL